VTFVPENTVTMAQDCAGIANIGREYTTQENPRSVLHDSQGFEAGSADNWNSGDVSAQVEGQSTDTAQTGRV